MALDVAFALSQASKSSITIIADSSIKNNLATAAFHLWKQDALHHKPKLHTMNISSGS